VRKNEAVLRRGGGRGKGGGRTNVISNNCHAVGIYVEKNTPFGYRAHRLYIV